MPERTILGAHVQIGFSNTTDSVFKDLIEKLQNGWVLDPSVYTSAGKARPVVLENAVIYHLIKYTEEELEAMAKEKELVETDIFNKKQGPKVLQVAKVPWEEVNDLLQKGYRIQQEWSKEALLYLYEAEEPSSEQVNADESSN